MKQSYKIGLRTIKTALAVFLCFVVALVFKRESAFYSTVAAVVCLQPTYEESYKLGRARLIGTLIGGVFGYLLLIIIPYIPYYNSQFHFNILIVPIFIMLIIYFCNIINAKAAISICCIVFLSIAISHTDISNTLTYVIDRMVDTAIGIITAMLINRFIAPVKPEQKDEIKQEQQQETKKS